LSRQKFIEEAQVVEKEQLNPTYFRIRLNAPRISRHAMAGQFINIRMTHFYDPLLPRPMSIFRRNGDEGWLEVLVRVVGRGSKALSQSEPGDRFTVLGPLGNGFSLPKKLPAVLIGGGTGIAPLVFLASELSKMDVPSMAVFGFRSQSEVCCVEEMRAFCQEVFVATDDGSYGFRGLIPDFFARIAEEKGIDEATLYVCGPVPMMSRIADFSRGKGYDVFLSVEAHMACGFGACVGCAVPRADGKGFVLACVDGPVFNAKEIRLGD